jgi:hypothetical protein
MQPRVPPAVDAEPSRAVMATARAESPPVREEQESKGYQDTFVPGGPVHPRKPTVANFMPSSAARGGLYRPRIPFDVGTGAGAENFPPLTAPPREPPLTAPPRPVIDVTGPPQVIDVTSPEPSPVRHVPEGQIASAAEGGSVEAAKPVVKQGAEAARSEAQRAPVSRAAPAGSSGGGGSGGGGVPEHPTAVERQQTMPRKHDSKAQGNMGRWQPKSDSERKGPVKDPPSAGKEPIADSKTLEGKPNPAEEQPAAEATSERPAREAMRKPVTARDEPRAQKPTAGKEKGRAKDDTAAQPGRWVPRAPIRSEPDGSQGQPSGSGEVKKPSPQTGPERPPAPASDVKAAPLAEGAVRSNTGVSAPAVRADGRAEAVVNGVKIQGSHAGGPVKQEPGNRPTRGTMAREGSKAKVRVLSWAGQQRIICSRDALPRSRHRRDGAPLSHRGSPGKCAPSSHRRSSRGAWLRRGTLWRRRIRPAGKPCRSVAPARSG